MGASASTPTLFTTMKKTEFWTFLTTAVTVNTVDTAQPTLDISGSFAHIAIEEPDAPGEVDQEPSLAVHPFTEEPITIQLPARMLEGVSLNDISAGNVIELVNKVLSLPFQPVPSAPSEAPIHRVPASRRPAFLEAMKKLKP